MEHGLMFSLCPPLPTPFRSPAPCQSLPLLSQTALYFVYHLWFANWGLLGSTGFEWWHHVCLLAFSGFSLDARAIPSPLPLRIHLSNLTASCTYVVCVPPIVYAGLVDTQDDLLWNFSLAIPPLASYWFTGKWGLVRPVRYSTPADSYTATTTTTAATDPTVVAIDCAAHGVAFRPVTGAATPTATATAVPAVAPDAASSSAVHGAPSSAGSSEPRCPASPPTLLLPSAATAPDADLVTRLPMLSPVSSSSGALPDLSVSPSLLLLVLFWCFLTFHGGDPLLPVGHC